MFEKTKALCDSFLDMGIPGFDMIVYHNGQEVLRYFNGFSDREKKIPIRGDERYYIYSCTKPITVTCAMQLFEQGKFSLDDPVSKYLPEFTHMQVKTEDGLVDAQRPILVRHLFTMTAGIVRTRQKILNSLGDPTLRETMKAFAREPLEFQPGDRYQYSLNHDVLGALIEIWSGESFQDYAKNHIFDPLGMKDTTYKLSVEDIPKLAVLYKWDKESGLILREEVTQEQVNKKYVCGGAGVVSTVTDYIKFCEALREGEKLLKRETIRLMTQDHLTPWQKRFNWKDKPHSYGLGMRVPSRDPHTEIRDWVDFGWSGMAGAFMAVDIPNKVTMFYVQHVKDPPNNGQKAFTYQYALEDMGLV